MKTDPRFPKLHIVDHPLVQHKLSTMREKKTPSNSFRQLLRELTYLIGYEVTRDLPLETRTIDNPYPTKSCRPALTVTISLT